MAYNQGIHSKYHVEVDFRDWPKGLSDEAKIWLTERVKNILVEAGQPLPLHVINDRVFERDTAYQRPTELRDVSLLDYQFACTERALRHLSADLVWQYPARW